MRLVSFWRKVWMQVDSRLLSDKSTDLGVVEGVVVNLTCCIILVYINYQVYTTDTFVVHNFLFG